MNVDTLRLTAEEAMGLLDRREASAGELHAAYLEAIEERNDELNAYLRTVDEADGDGVPIAYKDVISSRGVETTAGSKILSGYIPVFDSTVAARCRDAGLPLLGKTNMDEFAMGSSTENSAFGPTRNPWDPDRVPGGSSGGSAAAVAAGLAPWAFGSDTGGSVKQPASLCGIVGLRPTYGTLPRDGVVAFASSLDQIGPMTKTVRDNALLYRIVAPAEASSNLARYDGVRYGLRVEGSDGVRAMYDRTRDAGFGDEPKRRIMLGAYALSAGYYEAYYGQAQKVRTVIAQEHAAAFRDFDVLVSPTSPTVAFELGAKTANPLAMYLSDVLTIPSNMAGLPGLSIPCGLSEGLPVGFQLTGPQFSENTLFRAGHALEQAIGFDYVPERLSRPWPPTAPAGRSPAPPSAGAPRAPPPPPAVS